jgi:hypothetical protein
MTMKSLIEALLREVKHIIGITLTESFIHSFINSWMNEFVCSCYWWIIERGCLASRTESIPWVKSWQWTPTVKAKRDSGLTCLSTCRSLSALIHHHPSNAYRRPENDHAGWTGFAKWQRVICTILELSKVIMFSIYISRSRFICLHMRHDSQHHEPITCWETSDRTMKKWIGAFHKSDPADQQTEHLDWRDQSYLLSEATVPDLFELVPINRKNNHARFHNVHHRERWQRWESTIVCES